MKVQRMNRLIWEPNWNAIAIVVALWIVIIVPVVFIGCPGTDKGGDVTDSEIGGDLSTGPQETPIDLSSDSGSYEDIDIDASTQEFGLGAQKIVGKIIAFTLGLSMALMCLFIKAPGISALYRHIAVGVFAVLAMGAMLALIFAW